MIWEKYFPLWKMELTQLDFCQYHKTFGQNVTKICIAYVYKFTALVNKLKC